MKFFKLQRRSVISYYVLFVFLVFFQVQPIIAQSSQSEKVTIEVDKQPVEKVFNEITKQTGIKFFYGETVVNSNIKVSLSFIKAPVNSILSTITAQTNLHFNRENNTISVSKNKPENNQKSSSEKKIRIGGVVTDEKGEPIIGANIVEKGTSNGTISDIDGNYSLETMPNATLIVSYIGFTSKEIQVNNRSKVNISLSEDSKALSEVIVTALGIKREEKALGFSVQKIDGDDMSVVKGVNITTSLTGKVAGLLVSNSTEISEKPSISLRGNSPLIVIDGVAYGNMSLDDVSADDIESLDVLKGATASALYGQRGRDGAIMITTKKGEEGKLSVNVSNNTMFSAGYLCLPKVQSSYSTGNYGQMEYNSGYVWGDYMDGHEVIQYDPSSMEYKSMPLISKGKDNLSNFFRESMITNTNVNVSQKSKFGGFRVSATQIHHEGQYPNTQVDKYLVNGGGNIDYKNFKLDASFGYKKEKSPNMPIVNYGNGNILYNMLIWGGTEYDIRDFRNYWKVKDQKQNWGFSDWYDNPYYLVNERLNTQDNNLFNTNLSMSYKITDKINASFRSGFDNYNNETESRKPIGDSNAKTGYYGYSYGAGYSFNNDFMINGDFKWQDFTIKALAGASSYYWKSNSNGGGTRNGISIPGFYSLNASVERPSVWKSVSEKAQYGVYGKAELSWKNGIFVDITGRNDWSSTLPSTSRSYFYPSVATSFLPTQFYNPFKEVLDFWKIRGSWTISKKDLDVYDSNMAYYVSVDTWDGLATSSYPGSLRDPNIKPETERSYELGTDLRFFNNRLGFDYTYFNKLRYNRTMYASVSEASGFGSMVTNSQEELEQRGMEFTLRGKPIVTKDFNWETSVNASFWHWYYDKLDPNYSSQDPRLKEGERYDKFFTKDWERDHEGNIVHQAGLPVKNKYSSEIGNYDPDLILGFSNHFQYKNFDLNLSFDGRIGGLMYSWTEQAMWHAGVHPDSENQWRYDEVVNGKQNYVGNGVKIVSGSATYDAYGKVITDNREFASNDAQVSYQNYTQVYNCNPWDHQAPHNIKDATFIKLREIALNYTLPSSLVSKWSLQKLSFGIIGQNLFLWTKDFKFSDPDRGQENLNSPAQRYVGFNINVTL
ncbi:MAG: SusC/RagA family TonB-linked outer membrane protein [Parabacteroides sp.]|nr:SusC/RagA family TonB-linked outer membrane protein [Parabacteroides sp.]